MNEVNLDSFSNPDYNPGNPIKRSIWYFVNIFFFKSYLFPFYGIKRSLLRLFGSEIGQGVVIKPGVNIKYPWNLKVGKHSWIGENVWIDNLDLVAIGENCCLSQGVLILSGNHDYKKPSFDLMTKEIILENGVWIGAQSMVTSGVTCHSHSILSVQSIASSNLEAYTIYKGNPAVKVKERKIDS